MENNIINEILERVEKIESYTDPLNIIRNCVSFEIVDIIDFDLNKTRRNYIQLYPMLSIPIKGDIVNYENYFEKDNMKILMSDFRTKKFIVTKREFELNDEGGAWTIYLEPYFE